MRLPAGLGLALADTVGPLLLRALGRALRFELEGEEHLADWHAGRPVVFVLWHGRLLPLLYRYRGRELAIVVSEHRDGEYLARAARRLGYRAIRGSSTRGGVRALRASVRTLRRGRSLAVTPDGPRGPRERFKPGALHAARLAGAPVVPVSAGARRAWWIEGWDRFLVPKPFTRVRVVVGRPRTIERRADGGEIQAVALELEAELAALQARADRFDA